MRWTTARTWGRAAALALALTLALIALAVGGCRAATEGTPLGPDGAAMSDGAAAPSDGAAATVRPRVEGGGSGIVPGTWRDVPAGSFDQGSPADEPCRGADEARRVVTLTRGFAITTTEVTQEQFKQVLGYNPAFHASCGAACPVEWVSWHEAAAYCNALSRAQGRAACYSCSGSAPALTCESAAGFSGAKTIHDCPGYRLPTEAEWEYAARAGATTALHSGPITSCMTTDGSAEKIAWYKANSTGLPRPVGQKAANAWGLFDMSGNVYEWVHDRYAASYGPDATDPAGPAAGDERVFRGGAFYFNAEHARSAKRLRFAPTKRFTFLGFRCLRTR